MASLLESDKVLRTDVTTAKNQSFNMNTSMSNMPVHNHVEKSFDNIIKSPNDKREYRGLLLNNQMKVLLISEPTTDKSAAALNVNIGIIGDLLTKKHYRSGIIDRSTMAYALYMYELKTRVPKLQCIAFESIGKRIILGYLNDPDDLPGLAHFCEHMLFLGTEKYPEKNDYNKYLSQNSGISNASTYMDRTLYYFNVHSEKLRGALDRFAQFFIAPLFTEALTELELNAIHSEFENNLASDTWRVDQLEKSSADPKHPFSKFDSGNKETLSVIPKKKGINVREKLLKFHKDYYSSNVMALCVLGKESLDELEQMVVELFSHVKNKEISLPVWPEHPFNEQHFQTKWYVVPIKDTRNLFVIFPLPDLQEYYKSAPEHYISHLLGHEGEGSLLSLLKIKGWCNSLGAGKRLGGRGFNFYIIIVDLTEEGIQHVDDIMLLIFQYINMLKKEGPVEWIYNECRDIANMNFRFKEKSLPCEYVTGIAQLLCNYPMEEVLVAGQLFQLWKPDLIEWIMEYLKPENVRIHVIGKLYESVANETENWYGTKFKKEKIPPDTIRKWIDAGLNSNLKLPPKNEFIPENFDIKPAEDNITKFPVIIEDTPLIRFWFKQDNEFLVPKCNLFIDFTSPLAYMDPLSCNLTNIFVLLFRDALNEYAYAAGIAGLKWDLSNNKYGMTLGIAGYDDKQHILLIKIIDKMVNFKLDPKRHEICKENYIRSLKNYDAEQPYMQAAYYLAVLLSEQVWTKDDLLKATSQITVERVQQFIPQFLSKLHMECLIHGNVTTPEALEIAKLIESKLINTVPQIIPLLPRQLILLREIKLEDGCNFLFEVKNKYHNSSCTQVYYQVGLQSTESNMLLQLLAQILSEPCFTTLRTKEQLGYVVLSGIRRINGTQGLTITVQSNRHPAYVEQRISIFLNSMMQNILTMTEEEFSAHKESLAVRRLQKPTKMRVVSHIYVAEIYSQEYNFDRVNIEVAYLRTITREQIVKFYKSMLDSDERHKLSIHILSTVKDQEPEDENVVESNENIESSDETNVIEHKKIDDIMAFQVSQCLYPLMKPFTDIPRKGARSSKL